MAVCWIAVVMVFFTFSTTQEYYSMPIYPALALLIGSALAAGGRWIRIGSRVLLGITTALFLVLTTLLALGVADAGSRRHLAGAGAEPRVYTLSMGHIFDLTHGGVRLPEVAAGTGGRCIWLGLGGADDMAIERLVPRCWRSPSA